MDVRHRAAGLACKIVAAYVSNNAIKPDGVLEMLHDLLKAGQELGIEQDAINSSYRELVPAVPIGESITDEYIVCLEDGLRFKSLRRHLKQKYNMTADQYRERWGLPPQYPMVSPGYAKVRSEIAKAREQQKRDRRASTAAGADPTAPGR